MMSTASGSPLLLQQPLPHDLVGVGEIRHAQLRDAPRPQVMAQIDRICLFFLTHEKSMPP
jgi:hypothetical protein